MKILIRMIGIATTLFWIFLIVFFISAVYSAKDIGFDFGEPQVDLSPDNKILFSLPITIDNKGYYDVGSFNVTTEISDQEGFMITRASTFIPVIEKGRQIVATHKDTIDINALLQKSQDYLFKDIELEVRETVSIKLADVIPVQASTNLTLPWGAPLYNFTLGRSEYSRFNGTHVTATVPIDFENHASFDLAVIIRVYMYAGTNILVGEGQTTVETLQNTPYHGQMELDIPVDAIGESGHFEVYFFTTFFNFGPLVIPYG